MMQRESIHKGVRYIIMGLPVTAIIGSSFLPLQPVFKQLLVLAILIWFQVTIISGILPAR